MDQIRSYTVQTMKWTAMAGGYGAFFVGGLIVSSWLVFQFLVLLMANMP